MTSVPVWVGILTLVLTGGVGAGILRLIEAWINSRSSKDITNSTIRLNDIGALNQAIAGLSGENGRMSKRMADMEEQIAILKEAIDTRDKRIDILESEIDEQRRRRYELEHQIAVAEKKIDALAAEMRRKGLDPGPIMGVPF